MNDEPILRLPSGAKRRVVIAARFFVAAFLAGGVMLGSSLAEDVSGWTVTKNRDGRARANLFSANFQTVGSGAIVYHPQLEITCKPTRGKIWRTAILLRSSLAGGRTLRVQIRYDNQPITAADWTVDESRNAIFVDGVQTIDRIAAARTVTVSWSKGLFAGSGQAVFNLGNAASQLSDVAVSCNVPAPSAGSD